ncbi:pyruvate dehydrogenase phosphatase regulatory subunit, mitochondrial-like [Trichogramma pretiosum]|uniref:pyruvate dehydrogenase phosphatase regulatory subunit, mitochondrial-like n=1 Tax=Trichogramma pretiosum TaxID=7493 RepID=UPI0006C978FC|nr:pyruvate dehydrogenase phosphatase regulatory subunit, mitochondrial-like [Trichogramma pretiosum]
MLRKTFCKCYLSHQPLKTFKNQFSSSFISSSNVSGSGDDECLHSGLRSNNFTFNYDTNDDSTVILPSQAQIIIAGAGTVANSVAYHLVLKGWKDVLILDQNKIGEGTSHFGSGILGLFKPIAHRNLIQYSIKLYHQLSEMGYDIGLKQCGSINLAQTKDRMIALRRRMAYNEPTGLHCEVLSRNEVKRMHPYLHVDDLEGAVWVPEDAVADSVAICKVLANLAKQGGARYIEHCKIEKVITENGAVKRVKTNRGLVDCEYFVNCAGMWARDLGLCCNPPVKIPAYPAEHYYAIAIPNTGGSLNLPCVRDFDSYSYMRDWQGGILCGWFESEARPAFEGSGVPSDSNWKQHIQVRPEHWKPLWEKIVYRMPIMSEIKEPFVYNCPDTFTPDGRWIMGESSDVKNYYVACGMNGNSLQGAGGIGKEVAEWLIHGEAPAELLPFNVQRFLDLHTNKQYLQRRVREVVGRNYAILYPHQCEYKYARKMRCSPLYSVLEQRGAIFGIKMAYERPLYFDSTYRRGQKKPQMPAGSFYKPKFFDFMKQEFQACREAVGIIDMSSFSKIEIKSVGLEVVDYLQKLCSSDANIAIGSIAHTGMQNDAGGYENDCMLVRQAENSYYMVSPTLQQTRIYQWMSRHLPADRSVGLNDVTSKYTVVNVIGPKAAILLSELSNSDLKLPSFTYKLCNVGYASDVMVMAFTHTGEPGYCLHIPSEYALHVYASLMDVGRDYGLRDVGVLTQRFMRIERFIPFWAEELTPFVTPYEAGNGHRINLDKEYFIGKFALQRQKERGVTRRLVLFIINNLDLDKDVWAWGGEPIYRNGEFVGTVTSAGYGFNIKKLICLGFIGYSGYSQGLTDQRNIVTNNFILDPTARYEIDIAGHRFPMSPNIRSLTLPSKRNQRYIPTPVVTYKSDISH